MRRAAVLLGVTCALVLALGTQSASAVTLSSTQCPLPGSNFQGGDGNQLNASAKCPTPSDPLTAFIDWQGVQADSRTTDFNALPDGDLLHPGVDSTFAGGNKETEPVNWKINFPTMQVTPNKDNLFAAWEALAKGASGNAPKYMYLALSREVHTGDTHLEFELTQKPAEDNWVNSTGTSVPCRTNGDLLISYEVASGGSPPNVAVVIYKWTSATFAPANSGPLGSLCGATGTFTSYDPGTGNAEAAINKDDLSPNIFLTDATGNSTFDEGTFGEAALNLPGIFQAAGEGTCTNFGQFAVHSRSSTSIDSQMQDLIGPAPILVPSCTITTTADTNVDVGTPITDTAVVSLAYTPASVANTEIDFTAYDDAACTHSVFTDTQTPTTQQDGTLTATSADFNADAGHYYWQATFVDNGNGVQVAGTCGDETHGNQEQSVVKPVTPTLTTTASAPVQLQVDDPQPTIHDTAHLTGGVDPQGSINFQLFDNALCSGTPLNGANGEDVSVNGNNDYLSSNFTPDHAGTYRWVATFTSSDGNNSDAGPTACLDADEDVVVSPAQPTLTTTASAPVQLQVDDPQPTINDTAHFNGFDTATGVIRFKLFDNALCSGAPLNGASGQDVAVSGDGDYLSPNFTPDHAGTYRWTAEYIPAATEHNNSGAGPTSCSDQDEDVVVSPAQPTLTTTASPDTGVGHAIHDTAHFDGFGVAQGTINFKLYDNSNCSGTPLNGPNGQDVSVDGDGDYDSPDFIAPQDGTYRWVASFTSSDTNNLDAGPTACNDPAEQTHVSHANVAVDKTGPDVAHDGDVITFNITVTNSGTSPLEDVKLTDLIQGQTHGCDTLTGPTGDTNNDQQLQPTETWKYVCTYTVQHGDENATHHITNVATVQGTSFGDTVGPASDDATVLIIHPAIKIDKTGPATGQAGDTIGYVLTVTNPGDTPLADSTVQVTDPQCNGAPVALIGKGGDPTPGSLDPGDVWTYSCSVQTAVGDTAVHNTAHATGCDRLGGCVSSDSSADTTLTQPAQLVLPERVTPGSAQLVGPTGCVSKAFNARVRGAKIATVTFVLDGKVVKKVRNTKNATLIQLRVNPAKFKIGVHRLVVNVTFASNSGTKPKTIRLSFQRCAKKLRAPRFTG